MQDCPTCISALAKMPLLAGDIHRLADTSADCLDLVRRRSSAAWAGTCRCATVPPRHNLLAGQVRWFRGKIHSIPCLRSRRLQRKPHLACDKHQTSRRRRRHSRYHRMLASWHSMCRPHRRQHRRILVHPCKPHRKPRLHQACWHRRHPMHHLSRRAWPPMVVCRN